MAIAGIIAEYHPFHKGHAWQIGEIRRTLGADTAVVAVMSGNYVQRGDFAVMGKHARAEAAVLGGADLVLEIPTPWACATAEIFARGGVSLLAATGVVDHLVFGSESGELVPLQKAALTLESEEYRVALRRCLQQGVTFAAAREMAAREQMGEEAACLGLPNNNLAVEYLRACAVFGADMRPVTFPRVGAAHDSGEEEEISSASAIRGKILTGEAWEHLVPESTAAVLRREMDSGRAPVSMKNCERAVLSRLRRMGEEDFAPYDGGGEGLYHRFYEAVRREGNLEAILAAAKTKRYPMARLRRMLLHSYLDLTAPDRACLPPYLRVLAANGRGREVLRAMKKTASLPVVTKPAQARELEPGAAALFAREAMWTDLYELAMPCCGGVDSEFLRPAVML